MEGNENGLLKVVDHAIKYKLNENAEEQMEANANEPVRVVEHAIHYMSSFKLSNPSLQTVTKKFIKTNQAIF